MDLKIDESWRVILEKEFEKPYFKDIINTIKQDLKNGVSVYPPPELIFHAFNLTPFADVKCVILGQDPYHGVGQANGLCFSVNVGIPFPPSLKNIFKEIESDMGIPFPVSGDLTSWAQQGVLLLNAMLTVIADQPASHSRIGWEKFTDTVIRKISEEKEGVIFLLWGRFAQNKKALIDENKHFILETTHPSPFSVYRGFSGCQHFSKTNELLKKQLKNEINWEIKTVK